MRISHVQAKVLQWYLEAMGYVTFEEALAAGDATDIGFYQEKKRREAVFFGLKKWRINKEKMMLEILAWYEQFSTVVRHYWEIAKHSTREWLGPEPQRWFLLADGRILPSTIALPNSVLATTYEFDPHTNRMQLGNEEEGRFRPLPYLSLVVEEEDVGNTDLSDWLGELRAKPVPASMRVEQIITLWSLTNNQYLPNTNTTVRYTTSDGTETVVRL